MQNAEKATAVEQWTKDTVDATIGYAQSAATAVSGGLWPWLPSLSFHTREFRSCLNFDLNFDAHAPVSCML